MRVLFWVLAIFALAAGLVVAARYNTGYALLVFPPYRIELSLNLLALLVLGSALLAYLLIRVIAVTLGLPSRVRRYRRERQRLRQQGALLEALRESLAGRYARAEKAAESGRSGVRGLAASWPEGGQRCARGTGHRIWRRCSRDTNGRAPSDPS